MTAISELTEKQEQFFQRCDESTPQEIVGFFDDRGTGKTWALFEQANRMCCHGDDAVFGIIIGHRYTHEEAQSHFRKFPDVIYKYSRRQFDYSNGSRIYVMNRHDWRERSMGLIVDWVAFDFSCGEVPECRDLDAAKYLVRNSACGKIIMVGS